MTKARAQQLRRLALAAELARRHGGALWTPDHDCRDSESFVEWDAPVRGEHHRAGFRIELAEAADAAHRAAASARALAAALARAEAALAVVGLDPALASGPRFRGYLDAAERAGGGAPSAYFGDGPALLGLVMAERRRRDIEAAVGRAGLPARYAADRAFTFYRNNLALYCPAAAAAPAPPAAAAEAAPRAPGGAAWGGVQAGAPAVAARRAKVHAAAAAAGLGDLCWGSPAHLDVSRLCGLCRQLDAYVSGGRVEPGDLKAVMQQEADRVRQCESRRAQVDAALAAEGLSREDAARLYPRAQRHIETFESGEVGFKAVAEALRRASGALRAERAAAGRKARAGRP
jgi:hypothetical protein